MFNIGRGGVIVNLADTVSNAPFPHRFYAYGRIEFSEMQSLGIGSDNAL